MSPPWDRITALFGDALDRPPEARRAFLDGACSDPTVRAEVDALLNAYQAAPAFLDDLAERVVGPALGAVGEAPEGWSVGDRVAHYRIDGLAGRGGMGEVYRAWDTRLERPVALKVLPAHLSADAGARRRLVREARAAALDHPNIAAVYEIGETASGQVFLAMAYVEGATLRETLEAGPLPVPEAVGLACQVAEGLAAAHRHGVVHRDVKPSNVLVTPEGAVRLVDFGIATAAGATVTQDTSTRGTVAYMSPEQTRGEDVDVRTDVWSLGVVLYEMLAGRRPFRGDADRTVIHAIRHDAPEPVGRLRPDVPEGVSAIVARCLEKDPEHRPADMASVLAGLRAIEAGSRAPWRGRPAWGPRLGVAAALIVALVAGALALWPRAAQTADADVVRIAVLPLENLSADSADAYLADALTEELIGRLSTLQSLRVTARSSVVGYGETDKSLAEIAEDLGVAALLEGSVRSDGDRVRVAVRLVDPGRHEPTWSASYDAEAGDVLAVQGQIAEEVARALDVELGADERRRLGGRGTADVVAYDRYLKGRHLLHQWDPASIEAARDHFQQAIDRDPTFAEAWAGLADVQVVLGYLSVLTPKEAKARGRAAAERALSLDDNLAEAHSALASVLADDPRAWDAAEVHFRRAIALDPSYALAHQYYAELLRDQGRFAEALDAIGRAQTLDPLSPYAQLIEGIILWFAGQSDEALAAFERILHVHGEYPGAHLFAGLTLLSRGEPEAAIEAVERADPGRVIPDALGARAHALAMMGRRAEAEAVLDELEALSARQYVAPLHAAIVYASLGDLDRAFSLLDDTIEEESWFVRILKIGPFLDEVRADPRYPALLERAGLAG